MACGYCHKAGAKKTSAKRICINSTPLLGLAEHTRTHTAHAYAMAESTWTLEYTRTNARTQTQTHWHLGTHHTMAKPYGIFRNDSRARAHSQRDTGFAGLRAHTHTTASVCVCVRAIARSQLVRIYCE